jgi:hypothetical protein
MGWILKGGWRGQRVHRLAVIITDCFETVFGDLKVTLADPTGVIRCTVHKDAVAEEPWALRKVGL